jgi:phytanoyl-CoA hydroxylase
LTALAIAVLQNASRLIPIAVASAFLQSVRAFKLKTSNSRLSSQQLHSYQKNGFLVLPGMLSGTTLEALQRLAQSSLQQCPDPVELEANLGYPGAPESLTTAGGKTVRRLLCATQRDSAWKDWATNPLIRQSLQQLFNQPDIYLSQTHHNCLMTKSPDYSSDTGWHQDIRYWSFERPELISVWLALGQEQPENGGMWVIPGSHNWHYSAEQFDQKKFFRDDFSPNQALIAQQQAVLLNPGDVLFFDCKLLHRASRNHSQQTKFSLVFTYHGGHNKPVAGTRSTQLEEILL